MKLRTLGWAIVVIWAIGMTVALARIAGTLDSLAARPGAVPVAAPAAGPSEVAISLRAAPSAPAFAPSAGDPRAAPAPETEVKPRSPEDEASHQHAEEVLGQMVAKGGDVDDESLEALRQAIVAMRPEDRVQMMGAFAAAATRGEITVAPEDYRRILP
jgi:hypothetical protein